MPFAEHRTASEQVWHDHRHQALLRVSPGGNRNQRCSCQAGIASEIARRRAVCGGGIAKAVTRHRSENFVVLGFFRVIWKVTFWLEPPCKPPSLNPSPLRGRGNAVRCDRAVRSSTQYRHRGRRPATPRAASSKPPRGRGYALPGRVWTSLDTSPRCRRCRGSWQRWYPRQSPPPPR